VKINDRWTHYFMSLADVAAKQSKDPSTKVGCVISDPFDRTISTGYNGPPRRLPDTSEILANRELKLAVTLHAEMNAILFAQQDLAGCAIYVTHCPCTICAALIIQSGIGIVIAGVGNDDFQVRWKDQIELSKQMFHDSCVEYKEIER